jgi:arylsulfatase A-like enzyme
MLSALLATALAAPNLVVVSLDTTRVDALSSYRVEQGPFRFDNVNTPVLDGLAEEGVRFERFWANAPTTLNSHTTMFTGLDPHQHAVVRNGFPYEGMEPTLAERLGAVGYDRIAVLGAAALESRMGLDRGFRVYDDEMAVLMSIMYQDTAESVVQRTLAAVDERPDPEQPLFLFVHLYDAHTPYVPPQRFVQRHCDPTYRGDVHGQGKRFRAYVQQLRKNVAANDDIERVGCLYLSEVAYVDEQVGVLLDGLTERGLLDEALLVVTADHGESLAESRTYAYSHGSNTAEEVMHVPLIVRGYGVPLAERSVVESHAAMPGLAPTIERVLGLERTLGEHPDFYDLLRPGPTRDDDGWPERPTHVALFEASRPRQHTSKTEWNNLPLHRGIFAGGWGLWHAPFTDSGMHFYDGSVGRDAAMQPVLRQMLDRWDAAAPDNREENLAPSTTKALKALGYLDD